MNSRIAALVGFGVIIAALVLVVVIPRSGGDGGGSSTDLTNMSAKPVVDNSGKEAPTSLEIEDVVEGDGPAVEEGDTVKVQYVGTLFDGGDEFDSSWDRGEPAEFTLTKGSLIDGWIKGIPGMKTGGRRILTIPPDLGYGETGQPPTIPGNATLVFVVDLLEIQK